MANLIRCRSIRLSIGLCLLAGCGGSGAHNSDSAAGIPPIRVTTVQPQRKTLVRTVDLPGRTEAFEFAPLCAKVTGYVQKVSVDIGDLIEGPKGDKPGSVLCELLVPELNEELAEKVAAVAQAKSKILQADAEIKVAEAAVRSAEAAIQEADAMVAKAEAQYTRWKSENQRVAELSKSGAVTKKLADETKAEVDAADARRNEITAKVAAMTANHQEAIARLEKAAADAASIRSRLNVVEAEKRRVEAMVDFSILRAPFDGVVVERNVHTGHLVQAGSPKPLLSVMRVDPIRVFVDVPEDDAVHVSKGSQVELLVPSMREMPYVGTVTRTAWSLNTTSRTMLTEIDVPNPEGRWRPGLYVHAKITVAELKDVISVPKAAIVTQEKQTYCFCVDAQGTVVRRAVAVGLVAGAEVEIRNGLSGDEQVITVNANAFREGQQVQAVEASK